MAQARSDSASTTPRAPVAIRLNGMTIGFAVHEKRGVRFLAGHWRFDALDRQRFDALTDIYIAARKIANPDWLQSAIRASGSVHEREWELEEKV